MITSTNAFAPFIDGTGLKLGVQGAVLLVGGTTATVINPSTITLAANTTTYIYADPNAGIVNSNTSGFVSGTYPIAVVVTGNSGITSVTDSRCDCYIQPVGSGQSLPIKTVSGTYAPTTADSTILCNGTFTVTLNTTFSAGQTFRIKNIGTGTVTLSSAVNIDAATTFSLNSYQYQSVDVQYDGTQWWVL